MTKQMIVTTMANGQPQQVIIAGTNQQITLNKGMVIATTASVPTQGQPQQQTIQLQSSQQPQNQQQQQQQIVRSQPQTTTIQLQAPQQQQQPVQSQPQQQQQQQVCQKMAFLIYNFVCLIFKIRQEVVRI